MNLIRRWLEILNTMCNGRFSAEGNAFRRDINGLRALAVTAVVLFHFNIGGLHGGFVGVDVFFVISGFLMSGIIARGLQQGNFSIFAFYWSRAKRIIPALIVVAAILLVLGWFFLAPNEYKLLAKHARQSLYFLSNISYLRESGYFDSASHSKWLLHTWSLSVEWQFYLLLPILLTAVWKFFPGKKAMIFVHLIALACSFSTCLWLTNTSQQQAFYLLQSRAWEMLLGGLCFLLVSELKLSLIARRALESGGLFLIVASIFSLESSDAWPGFLALLPTIGAVMVLAAKREDSLWSNNRITKWLGTRSYSLYLWHWPLVAGLFFFYQQDNTLWITGAILLALLMSELSYRMVEQPVRRGLQQSSLPRAVASLAGLVILSVSAAQFVVNKDGLSDRMPAEIIQMIEKAQIGNNPRGGECLAKGVPCVYGGPDIKAIIIGDSHASALVTVAQGVLSTPEQGIYFEAAPGCLPVPGLNIREHFSNNHDDPCIHMKEQLAKTLETEMSQVPLIIINRTSMYPLGYNGIDQTLKRKPQAYASTPVDEPSSDSLKEFGQLYIEGACAMAKKRPVYLMRPIPEMKVEVPDAVGKEMLLGSPRDFTLSREEYKARNDFVWSIQDQAHEQCGVHILDPLPYLCDEKVCYGSKSGEPLYLDDNHLNALGGRLLAPMFSKAFSSMPYMQVHVRAAEANQPTPSISPPKA
ncbi:acyltransferase family protein [Pseudomonas sp. NPDC087697]|uniref:acyltransferase family protein n=1 Tax=Pseudomonas sp. NPDC087697 TaxID=3364447 RepID=UPI003824F05A